MYYSCILDSAMDLLICQMVFVRNAQKSPIASYLKGLDSTFKFCCKCSALTGTKEGR